LCGHIIVVLPRQPLAIRSYDLSKNSYDIIVYIKIVQVSNVVKSITFCEHVKFLWLFGKGNFPPVACEGHIHVLLVVWPV